MNKSNWMKAAIAAICLCLAPFAMAADEPNESTQQLMQLDINSADVTAIAEALEGVGMQKAQEIVVYREMFGKFHSIDELAEVKGIGAATVEKNRHRIVIINN